MSKRVLIVEDSTANRQLLKDLIERVFVCEAEVACDGREALDKAEGGHFDLILMDLKLPVMDGIEATRALKDAEETRMVPVLALTGYIAGDEEDRMSTIGFDGFLPKPFDVPKLLSVVSEYLPPRKDL